MILTDLTGLFGIASAMTAAVVSLPRVKQLDRRKLAMLAAAVFFLLLIPLDGLPLAGYARGMVGDLSITSVVLVWAVLLHPCPAQQESRTPLLILIAAAALFLYPMTLGMSLYDPYRLGYHDMLLVGVVLLVACFAWLAHQALITLCLALATLAWSLGWYESSNLWDYLLDPLVAIYAIAALLKLALNKSRSAVRTADPDRNIT